MIVVRGKKTSELGADALRTLLAPYDAVTVDLGAGDGRFAYRYAQQHSERFTIAIDPVAENLAEMSAKAAGKPARGGVPNALFVVGSVERVPDELRAIADEAFVNLPWGSLMRGLILGDAAVLGGVASLAKPGAAVRVVLNTRIFDDPVPLEARDLPELTPEYARETLAPVYERHGLRLIEARWMDADEVAALGTTWAKRLSHRSPPRSVYLELQRT
jgi:16S rRNA (adenine(1408)-N(1))-methyltransferase